MAESDFSCPCIIGYGSSPSRCGSPYVTHHSRRRRPGTRSPRFRRDPFARNVLFDPGGMTMSRISTLHMLRSAISDSLRSRGFIISWLYHTPRTTAVYASCSASPPPHATLASRRLARPYLGRTCTGWIAPALPGAFHSFDDLVGTGEQHRRDLDAERFGSLEVDHKFISGWVLHRQIGRLLALQDAINVAGSIPKRVNRIGAVSY